MPERDANQLAAGEAIALLRRRIDNLASDSRDDAGHAALDELVALAGTLQQERDAERRWCKHWAERAEAAEAALTNMTGWHNEAQARVNELEAALATTRQAFRRRDTGGDTKRPCLACDRDDVPGEPCTCGDTKEPA